MEKCQEIHGTALRKIITRAMQDHITRAKGFSVEKPAPNLVRLYQYDVW